MPLSYGDYLTTDCRFRYNRFAEIFQSLYGLTASFTAQSYVQGGKTREFDYLFDISRPSSKYVYGTGANTGKIVEVPADTPAFQHDPITGERLGLSIEPSATNLFLHSGDFTQPSWVKLNADTSVSAVEAPLPSEFMTHISPSNTDGAQVYQSASVTASTNYIATFYAKTSGGIDISENLCSFYDESNASFIKLKEKPNKLYELEDGTIKFSIEVTTPSGCTSLRFYIAHNNSSGVRNLEGYYWGAQLEQGSKATSYIPTSGSTATRAADIVTSQAATFGEWFDASEGTFEVEWYDDGFIPPNDISPPTILSVDNNGAGAATGAFLGLQKRSNGFYNLVLRDNSGGFNSVSTGVAISSGEHKGVISFSGNTAKLSVDASSVVSGMDFRSGFTQASIGRLADLAVFGVLTAKLINFKPEATL